MAISGVGQIIAVLVFVLAVLLMAGVLPFGALTVGALLGALSVARLV